MLLAFLFACISAQSILNPPLSSFVQMEKPWMDQVRGSLQQSPVYMGKTPREIELNIGSSGAVDVFEIPRALKVIGENRLQEIYGSHIGWSHQSVTLEAWPVYSQTSGQRMWAWSRWSSNPGARTWTFFESQTEDEVMEFPTSYRPWNDTESFSIYAPFWQWNDLYASPCFSDCIWSVEEVTDLDSKNILGGWYNPDNIVRMKTIIEDLNQNLPIGSRYLCRQLPQPMRYSGVPTTLMINVDVVGSNRSGLQWQITWDSRIKWVNESQGMPNIVIPMTQSVRNWPSDTKDIHLENIMQLDGEKEAFYPLSNRTNRFVRKNAAQPDNQILQLIEWLEERYKALGITTSRQSWTSYGLNDTPVEQANLIAVIPGRRRTPVVLADHIDTAFAGEVFEKTGQRVSVPGADDNCAATSSLLIAAEMLRNMSLEYDVWLLHLTGEEYPMDDLGARQILQYWLRNKIDIRGMVLLDMSSFVWHKGDPIFQINAGYSQTSLYHAKIADTASRFYAPQANMQPVFRERWSNKSYLYNTDGILFSDAGYPVIYINEHINYLENFDRPCYHEMCDTASVLDLDYGTVIMKIAVETVAQIASSW